MLTAKENGTSNRVPSPTGHTPCLLVPVRVGIEVVVSRLKAGRHLVQHKLRTRFRQQAREVHTGRESCRRPSLIVGAGILRVVWSRKVLGSAPMRLGAGKAPRSLWRQASSDMRPWAEPVRTEEADYRPKAILLSICCSPGDGSEGGTGWTWARLASEVADVILMTDSTFRARTEKAIAELGLPIRTHFVKGPSSIGSLERGSLHVGIYNLIWQVRAAREIRQLERRERIDVVHHTSFSSSSLPTALLASKAPVRIWGPVGGATRTSLGLYRYLTPRGMAGEIARDVVNGLLRATWGTWAAKNATLVVALNGDDERRFRRGSTPVVVETTPGVLESALKFEPQVEFNDTYSPQADAGSHRVALFVARLLPWKGLLLAIESLRYAPNWKLVVFGDGPDKDPAEKLAARLQLSERIEFRGRQPRPEVLGAVRTADALLFPSFHDSAGWAAGEASAMGCPVVCLDRGGPALQAGRNAYVVPVNPAGTLDRRIGECLEGLGPRGAPDYDLLEDRIPALLKAWYAGWVDADCRRV